MVVNWYRPYPTSTLVDIMIQVDVKEIHCLILCFCPFWQSEEALSVYLEYVSGGSIHKLLQEYGSFSEPVIRNYARQITSGLAYLHGRNVVHRYMTSVFFVVNHSGSSLLCRMHLVVSSFSFVIATAKVDGYFDKILLFLLTGI